MGLCRFHLGPQLQTIDAASEPSIFEIYANERDLEHVAFHLDVPLDRMARWVDREGVPLATTPSRSVVVMRSDDNGNDVEVRRFTNRCEADALMKALETRGHKQLYWIAGV